MISKNTIKLIQSLKQKKNRQEKKLFIIEGEKMVDELLNSSFKTIDVYSTKSYFDKLSRSTAVIKPILINEKELKQISQLKTPNQVLALAEIPSETYNSNTLKQGLSLALDTTQDPGNMGTIIRTANWFGVECIFCSEGCVDIYNPKVVQATMGALFKTKVIYTNLKQLFTSCKDANIPIYGTSLSGKNLYKKVLRKNAVIVMGNESKGLSEELQQAVDEKILIPTFPESCSDKIESLNVAVATSIILSEFRRQA